MSRTFNGQTLTFRWAVAITCVLLPGADPAHAGRPDHPKTVTIEKVTVAPRDSKTATVSFDLSWKGSWRHEGNHDAVWVFFKVQAEGGTDWQPVRLVADKVLNPAGYGQDKGGTPLDFIVPRGEDGFVGMFVRRAEFGQGTVRTARVTAVWDFVASEHITRDVNVSMRAFGIEMVYVPTGPYYLGTHAHTDMNDFYRYRKGEGKQTPYHVTGPGAIPTGRQEGRLWASGAQPDDGGEIPASFPNGYPAIYCMKKMITGSDYCGFLNTLAPEEAAKRYCPAINRSGKAPDYTYSVNEEQAVHNLNPLSWADGAVFGAWAGLRPMTELEFEKITVGPIEPGWDTGHSLDFPSYWDVRDSNGWRLMLERVVTVGNPEGRCFKGTHGRGTLQVPADWPQDDAVGVGFRGGYGPKSRPSQRLQAATISPERERFYGWRGVRTAPEGVGL